MKDDIIGMAQPECSHHFIRDEEAVKHYCCQKCGAVKVEQPEQEPVAWRTKRNGAWSYHANEPHGVPNEPLYTTPPAAAQRPLVWLSEEDEREIKDRCTTVACVLRAVKAKLKGKNK